MSQRGWQSLAAWRGAQSFTRPSKLTESLGWRNRWGREGFVPLTPLLPAAPSLSVSKASVVRFSSAPLIFSLPGWWLSCKKAESKIDMLLLASKRWYNLLWGRHNVQLMSNWCRCWVEHNIPLQAVGLLKIIVSRVFKSFHIFSDKGSCLM